MTRLIPTHGLRLMLATGAVCAIVAGGPEAQTKITPDKNKYTPAQDVQIGQEAAAEAKKQLPILDDDRIDDWVDTVGRQLVAAIPAEFAHREFRYTFDVVNQKEINAFALPGGPMFLNRGMIEAAKTEAEVAGVMAHEISHVALRHGTAQATKGEKFQIGAILGQVAGAVIGGTAGSIIAQGSQFGLGTYFLKYGRAAESQADLLGAQILARAGYDPRQMANMFKTIEAQGSGGGPEFLSSHPNPGNRYNAINKEASMLRVQGNADTGQFRSVQQRLGGMSPALTAEQIAANQKSRSGGTSTVNRRPVNVERPSAQGRTYQAGKVLRITVPANWRQTNGEVLTYAPEGGYYTDSRGGTSFTHGLQVGVAQGGSDNLQRDTDALIQGFAKSNANLRNTGSRRESLGGRTGLTTFLTNVSDATGGQERIALSTTYLRDGNVLFLVGVSPRDQAEDYEVAFRGIRRSLQISD